MKYALSLIIFLVAPLITFAQAPASCTQGGKTIASGTSSQYYLMSTVLSGNTCASIATTRTCTNGALSGDTDYSKGSCTVLPATTTPERQMLGNFLPYVFSTTWYPWFNDTVGIDPSGNGLTKLTQELPKMKAAGINTVWLTFPWQDLQPTAGTWNEAAFTTLVQHLQAVQQQGTMRVILPVNYVGPGFSPNGIDPCKWMQRPAEVAKFNKFVERLAARLENYNYMIYYIVYTEYPPACSISTINNTPFFATGIKYISNNNPNDIYDYTWVSVDPTNQTNITNHYADVHTVNQWLKQSVGRVTAPQSMNQTVRSRISLGIHDTFVPGGEITDDAPIESISYFDFYSIPYYLSPTVRNTIPIDLAFSPPYVVTQQMKDTARNAIFNALNQNVANIRRFYPSVPLLLGEYGYNTYDPGNGYVQKIHSPSKNLVINAMIDWSFNQNPRVGFNLWAWTGRHLDMTDQQVNTLPVTGVTPAIAAINNAIRSENAMGLVMHSWAPTTVLDWVKCRLLGGACPTQ